MAPTEVLAQQHHDNLVKLLAGGRVRVAMWSGSVAWQTARAAGPAHFARRRRYPCGYASDCAKRLAIAQRRDRDHRRAASIRGSHASAVAIDGRRSALPRDDGHSDSTHRGDGRVRRPRYFRAAELSPKSPAGSHLLGRRRQTRSFLGLLPRSADRGSAGHGDHANGRRKRLERSDERARSVRGAGQRRRSRPTAATSCTAA